MKVSVQHSILPRHHSQEDSIANNTHLYSESMERSTPNQQFFSEKANFTGPEEQYRTPISEDALKTARYLEAQPRPVAVEHNVSLKSKLMFLGGWFSLNLILTISNKAVLAQV